MKQEDTNKAYRPDAAQVSDWQEISNQLRIASAAVESAMTTLMLSGVTSGPAYDAIDAADAALSGLAYRCTPQSEWCGNDSNGDPIFKYRWPHIVKGQ